MFLLFQCLTEAAFAQKYHHEDSLTREQTKKMKREEFPQKHSAIIFSNLLVSMQGWTQKWNLIFWMNY
jgi:hypothetical protein